LTPDDAITAGSARTPEVGGDVRRRGEAAVHAAEAARAHEADPDAAAATSVPPTVVAPTAPWTAQTARSRGPSLRRRA
jgi:hypothetical protein